MNVKLNSPLSKENGNQDKLMRSSTPAAVSHRDDPVSDGLEEVKVTFFPNLNDTRRAWMLTKLRQEYVSSVLDVGCGDGTLLSCLSNCPAFFNPAESTDNKETGTLFCSSECDGLPDLRISRLAGLDISRNVLERCLVATAPPDETDRSSLPRWERLEGNIWHGSLDAYNEVFVDTECIVASEVIEHLLPSVLSAFAPTLLGLYRPRLLLITTPNYAFNARFSAPGTVDPAGFPDPTGRTTRVFRHHDHKFEWTPSEFRAWCTESASAWGYTVEVDAIGLPIEPDPWGRNDEVGCASQVALFRRMEDWEGQRPEPLPPSQEQQHKLLTTHVHIPHPRAGIPESQDRIAELVSQYMESYYFEDGYSVWDLWVENSISIGCGGRLDLLLSAIEGSYVLSLARIEGAPAREWNVKFSKEKHRDAVEKTKNTHYWDRTAPRNPTSQDQSKSPIEEEEADKTSQPRLYDWFQLSEINRSNEIETRWEG